MKKALKILLIILTGLLVAGITFTLNKSYINKHTNFKTVAIAKETVTPYGKLAKYELVKVVSSAIPEDAITDLSYLQKKEWFAGKLGIGTGDVIRKSRLVDEKSNPFGPALAVKNNKVLVGVVVDQAKSTGGNIKPGVLTNAVVFLAGDSRAGTPDRVISSDDDALLGNLLVKQLQNSDVGAATGKGKEAVPAVAIIETSLKAAKTLVKYQEIGKVYLVPVGVDIKTLYKVADQSSPTGTPVSAAPKPAQTASVQKPAAPTPQPTAPVTTPAPADQGRTRTR